MNRKRVVVICLVALLLGSALLIPGVLMLTQGAGGTLSTDNMAISWDETGAISSVILQGKEMIAPSTSGFVITDAAANQEYAVDIPVKGGRKKKQSGTIEDADLKMKVTYRRKGHAIYVEGTVTDTSKTDRLLRLEYMLPVASEGMYWYDDISTTNQIRAIGNYSKVVDYAIDGHPMSLYPYGTISNGEQAVAFGVPMEQPQSYLIGYKNSGNVQAMTLQFNFALSPKTKKLESKADFSFVIYAPTEPEWGFRSASQDYYDLYPDSFEVKSDGGNWLFQHTYDAVEGVEDFYFGYNETPTFGYYAIDKKYGVASLEYTAPAEQWMEWPGMPKEPEPTYEQYMGRLNELINDTTGAMEPAFPEVTQKDAAEALKNSAILLENGKYHTMGWYAYGITVGFVTNHNPDIPGWNSYKLQVSEIERAEAMAKAENSRLAGVYIDNLAGVGSLLNYREDHFAYVDMPLLWNVNNKRLVIPAYSGMYSYTKAIRERCEQNDQILVANMVFPERGIAQYVHLVDVPGSECGPSWGWDPHIQRLRRTMAYRKPWMLLLGHDLGSADWGPSGGDYATKEAIMKSSIAYGLFANVIGYRTSTAEYEVTRPLFRKYTYIAVVQDKLGWSPVTYATPGGTGHVDCERFGDLSQGAAIFTAYNTGEKSGKFDGVLNVDLNAMKLTEERAKSLLAFDMINNTFVPVTIKDGILTYDVELAQLDVSAVMIGTKEEIFEWMFERIKDTLRRGDETADEINGDQPWGHMSVPKPWAELSNKLATVSPFRDKQTADALADVKTLVVGLNEVVAATDNAINVLFSYTNELTIDVKNIYGDAYAILSGLFGADGNKDHSGLNQYEGVMQVVAEDDSHNGLGSVGIVILCVAVPALAVVGGVVAFLSMKKKKKGTCSETIDG